MKRLLAVASAALLCGCVSPTSTHRPDAPYAPAELQGSGGPGPMLHTADELVKLYEGVFLQYVFQGQNATLGTLTLTGALTGTSATFSGTYTCTIASGSNCLSISNNGARLDLGTGATDYLTSDGISVVAAGQFGAVTSVNAPTLKADSFQTYSGGAQAMLIGTTGTGQLTIGNATSSTFNLNGSVATFSGGMQVNGGATIGATQANYLNLGPGVATGPAPIATLGTNAGIQFKVTGTGVVSAVAPLVSFVPKRMSQEYHVNLVTDTAFTAVGLPAPTLLAGTPTADTTDVAYQMIKFTTGATSGNASGFSGPFTVTAGSYLPVFAAVVRTDPAAVTTTRNYVGFGASSLDQVATLAGANAIRGCWFRYDTGLSDANWFAESSDGTTASATDTTVVVAAATTYTLAIDATTAGACDFYVNGTLKTHKTSNVPTASNTALGLEASVTTLAASARALSVSKAILQQN